MVKISILTIVTGNLIKAFNIGTINLIFDSIFFNFIPIIFLVMILGFILDRVIFYKDSNFKTEIRYLNYLNIFTYIFLLISCTHEIIYILISIAFQLILISFKFIIENKNIKSKNKKYSLYNTRKKQLEFIKELIVKKNYENYAISINGVWGSGKSELISALINELELDGYNNYIYISPLVNDTRESLVREFRKSLSDLMKNSGIYVGQNSSLDKYFKEVLKLIQFNSKFSMPEFISFISSSKSYKNLKEELQSEIDLLLHNKKQKLIIVIDDFDRVDESKQLEILSFIKEIISFNGCITIIALDYDNLKHNKIVKQEYLEKFIAISIPLVDVKFKEIILFHVEDILNERDLKNDFSKKILRELKENIYNYYYDINTRIETYYQEEKEKNKLKSFKSFAIERKRYINNSRRIIYFLNELQNSIELLDKLYDNRVNGEELLNSIRTSEIIYFLNFIKVFYKDSYEHIIKLKGIDEYYEELLSNDMDLEATYFNVVLGDIIPKKNIYQSVYLVNEKKELIRLNSLNLVKDLFVDYYFMINNINLLTNSEICIDNIDNNNLSLNEKNIEKLVLYQQIIFYNTSNEEKIIIRIEKLSKYITKLHRSGNIDYIKFLEVLSTERRIEYNFSYVYYLKEIFDLVNDGKIERLSLKNNNQILSLLRDLELDSISKYKYIFIQLLIILDLDNCNDDEINHSFQNVVDYDKLFNKIKEFVISKNIISNNYELNNLNILVNNILKLLKSKNFKNLELVLLNKRLDEFLLIYEYVSKIKRFCLDTYDKHENLYSLEYIDNVEIAKEILRDLNKKQNIDENMMSSFQKSIKFIIEKKSIDKECMSNVSNILKKLKIENCWHEHGWLDIMVNIERILRSKL